MSVRETESLVRRRRTAQACRVRDGDEVRLDAGLDAEAEGGVATDAEVYRASYAGPVPGFSPCPPDLEGYVSLLPRCP